jgi:hypothetical protein
MSSRERFASASICSRSAIKASANSPCGDDHPRGHSTNFIVKAFVDAVIGMVADLVSPNSIIESADVRDLLH